MEKHDRLSSFGQARHGTARVLSGHAWAIGIACGQARPGPTCRLARASPIGLSTGPLMPRPYRAGRPIWPSIIGSMWHARRASVPSHMRQLIRGPPIPIGFWQTCWLKKYSCLQKSISSIPR